MRVLVQILSKQPFLVEAKLLIILLIPIILTLLLILLSKLPVPIRGGMIYALNKILWLLMLILLLLSHSYTHINIG